MKKKQLEPAPKLPEELKGKTMKQNKYCKTASRKWSEEELEFCKKLKADGYTINQIAEATGRSYTSVRVKLMRESVFKEGNYGKDHADDKTQTNLDFIEMIKPTSVLDVYCGKRDFYKQVPSIKKVISNDKDKSIETADYHEDSLKFLARMYTENNYVDLVDLDPYGSAYKAFPMAIRLAKKALIVTFGELKAKDFKRLDFVKGKYPINSFSEFNTNNLIKGIQIIGEQCNKLLTPVIIKEWKGISRVYFSVSKKLVTEQWEKTGQS